MVTFKYPDCNHNAPNPKKCSDPITTQCKVIVNAIKSKCKHVVQKTCYQSIDDVICRSTCGKTMSCGKHKCTAPCGIPHSHEICDVMIQYKFPDCQHVSPIRKKCTEIITWPCRTTVGIYLKKCNHFNEKPCYQPEAEVQCNVMAAYDFPACGHPSPTEKRCSAPITAKCRVFDYITLPKCHHEIKQVCSVDRNTIICPFPRCRKKRICGHPCTKKCGEDCNSDRCPICGKFAQVCY